MIPWILMAAIGLHCLVWWAWVRADVRAKNLAAENHMLRETLAGVADERRWRKVRVNGVVLTALRDPEGLREFNGKGH